MRILLVVAFIFFASCSSPQYFVEQKEIREINIDTNQSFVIKDKKAKVKDYISINQIRLDEAINRLAQLNKITYVMYNPNDFKKIYLVANKIKIQTLEELKIYLEETTEFTITYLKNEYIDTYKIIQLQYKNSLTNNIVYDGIENQTLQFAIKEIAKKLKYSIIIKDDIKSKEILISYLSGKNIYDLLNQLQNGLNIYITLDNKNKTIILEKYQNHPFEVGAYNLTDSFNTAISLPINSTSTQQQATDIIQSLKTLVKNRNYSNNEIIFEQESGILNVYSDYKTYLKIVSHINKYKEITSRQVQAIIKINEFYINDELDYGLSLRSDVNVPSQAQINTQDLITNIIERTILGTNLSINFKDLNNMITQGKSYNYPTMLKNRKFDTFVQKTNKEVFKDIKEQQTQITDTQIQLSSEVITEKVEEGITIEIHPILNVNNVDITFRLQMQSIADITPFTSGGKTTYLIDTNSINTNESVRIKYGEEKIIKSYTSYEISEAYQGSLGKIAKVIGSNNKFKRKKQIVISIQILTKE